MSNFLLPHIFFLAFFYSVLFNVSAQNITPKTDLETAGLKGKVTQVRTETYIAIDKFGEITKGDRVDENTLVTYNSGGMVVDSIWYFPDSTFLEKKYSYLNGRCTGFTIYNEAGRIMYKTINKFDVTGNKITSYLYDSTGATLEYETWEYNSKTQLKSYAHYDKTGALIDLNNITYDLSGRIAMVKFRDGSYDEYINSISGDTITITKHSSSSTITGVDSVIRFHGYVQHWSSYSIDINRCNPHYIVQYDKHDNPIQLEYLSGCSHTPFGKNIYERTYDAYGNCTKCIEYYNGAPQYVYEYSYRYLNDGKAPLKGKRYLNADNRIKVYGGEYVHFDEKGQKVITSYAHGKINGVERRYNLSGQLISQTNYVNGVKEGVEIIYAEDGSIKSETNFKNGMRNGVSKSYRMSKRANGITYSCVTYTIYVNDTLNGPWEEFMNGQLSTKSQFVKGKEQGVQSSYFEGRLSQEIYIKDGLFDGVAYDYNNGRIISISLYRKGKEVDGSLVVDKNGQGLTPLSSYPAWVHKNPVSQFRDASGNDLPQDQQMVTPPPSNNQAATTTSNSKAAEAPSNMHSQICMAYVRPSTGTPQPLKSFSSSGVNATNYHAYTGPDHETVYALLDALYQGNFSSSPTIMISDCCIRDGDVAMACHWAWAAVVYATGNNGAPASYTPEYCAQQMMMELHKADDLCGRPPLTQGCNCLTEQLYHCQ